MRWVIAGAFALAATSCGGGGGSGGGQTPPPPPPPPAQRTIHKTVLAMPLNEPVSLDVLADGSVFVVERNGRVLIWREGTGVVEAGRLTSLYQPPPGDTSEFGLLAIAAHPDYAANGYVFVMYDAPLAGGVVAQRVARFRVSNDRLDPASETVLLSIPFDDTCCHTGGSMRFDAGGLLYIATGDNSDPFVDNGYAPIDPRPGRTFADALRSAGNTNDLRGKILRIRPTASGGYQIPAGNLFGDPADGRLEIYAMGLRNPYTMAIDAPTGDVYVGDVGPDANADSAARGPRGYDEINRITEAANLGWPLFIGANLPYREWNYDTGVGGAAFDPAAPANASPRNTGAAILPPARPSLLAYAYDASATYPALGQGGRSALVAGIYRAPATDLRALPASYAGQLFIADFMRDLMMNVTLTPQGDVASVARFAPNVALSSPLDFEFGPDGALYVVEYGDGFFTPNADAALSRIEFSVP